MSMSKAQFDGYRQGVYNQAASIVDRHDQYRNAGALTAQALEYFIFELRALMAEFKAIYEANRRTSALDWSKIEASWIDPRFHDYYDFFTTIANGWERDLSAMPPDVEVAPSSPGVTPAIPAPEGSGWTVQAPGSAPSVSVVTQFPGGLLEPPSLLPVGGGEGLVDTGSGSFAPEEEGEPVLQAGIGPGVVGLVLFGGLLLALRGSGGRGRAKG